MGSRAGRCGGAVLAAAMLLLSGGGTARGQKIESPAASRSSAATLNAAAGADAVAGTWIYRSFRSSPALSDPERPLGELLFGQGELRLVVTSTGSVSGSLGGTGWRLDLAGTYIGGTPATLKFRGRGTIGGEEWVYDYVGYVVPAWPNGVDQRPAIVGSIVRTIPHSGGAATAGFVAQWIAVRTDTADERLRAAPAAANPAMKESYRRELLQQFYGEGTPKPASNADGPKKPAPKNNNPKSDQSDKKAPKKDALKTEAPKKDAPKKEAAKKESPKPAASDSASVAARTGTNVDVELTVDYAVQRIGDDDVRLRCYNGLLAGPTIRAKAGDTLRITLRNKLPVEPGGSHQPNTHHEWNTTNLHFHGLHVAPQGTPDAESDNVLLSLTPTTDVNGSVQRYAVQIPSNHVAGTFWYHAHRHGSTAAQVSSGMAGALIIERNDDVHNLDAVRAVREAGEEILLLQQIPYLKPSGVAQGFIERSADGSGGNELAMFGPPAWNNLRRYVTVNGVRIPTITVRPGEVRRLRFIHSGQRQEMLLKVNRRSGDPGPGEPSLPFHEIAVDGLPLGEVRERETLSLYPGYRSDVLIRPGEGTSGEFELVDLRGPAGTGADGSPEPLRLVARINVTGTPAAKSLPTDAEVSSHRLPLISSPVTGTQFAFYGIVPVGSAARFYISQQDLSSGGTPTGSEFGTGATRTLSVNATERWVVGTRNGAGIGAVHPFHIHINPFFVEEVRNVAGQDVTAAEIGGPTWRDTLAMRQGFTYKLLTRYDDFSGDFVNHCHILDHEDNGMMELVRIIPSGGPTPVASPLAARGRAAIRTSSGGDAARAGTTTRPPITTRAATGGRPSVQFFVKGSLCPHCMAQLTEMATRLKGENLDVTVVSASTEEDLKQFPQVPFKLKADPELKLFKAAGAFDGEPKHATIVRNAAGKETFRDVGDEPFLEAETILARTREAGPRLVVAVRGTDEPEDDYLTWAPARCQVRIVGGAAGDPDRSVEISNEAAGSSDVGTLLFDEMVAAGSTATRSSITLTVRSDGTPTEFFAAGKTLSRLTETSLANRGRDAVILARAVDGGVGEGRAQVMVRVRRNATGLNPLERSEYLNAVAQVKARGRYEELVTMHRIATGRSPGASWPDQAHRDAGFLPWHRAFLATYERELQKTHPHVALHYWREDERSTVFEKEFLGANPTLPGSPSRVVDFGLPEDGNPLFGWSIEGAALTRFARNRLDTSWCRAEATVLSPDSYESAEGGFRLGVEGNPHNSGHGWVGIWMAGCQTSPRDPIFFLFHCDIDRLWAKWQRQHGRFGTDGSDERDYFPNDAYTTGSSTPLGHHLKDSLWPWDNRNGAGDPLDPLDDRPPASTTDSSFAASGIPGVWPASAETPFVWMMIDYLGRDGTGIDLGFCYDDVPFGEEAASPAIVGPREPLRIAADRKRNWTERLEAVRSLSHTASADETRALLSMARDRSESDSLRSALFAKLAVQGDAAWISAAVEIVRDEKEGESLRASVAERLGIAALLTRTGHAREAEIDAALRTALDRTAPEELRSVAVTMLTAHEDSETVRRLTAGLANPDEAIVPPEEAIWLLAGAMPGRHHDVLRRQLKHESDGVRIAALLCLGTDRGSFSDRVLIAKDADEKQQVRSAALRSLMHDDDFPELSLSIVGDPTEGSSMRAAAAACLEMHVLYHGRRLSATRLGELRSRLNSIDTIDRELGPAVRRAVVRIEAAVAVKLDQ